ncbi:hypothetical protein IFM89_017909 [Coptis chinensis]|uniref:Pentatricopeptide repeat-containing protein n=1 Tax=Coptis chinensis TaxID=261450 RepID=A0A835IX88_9MAGN|nr:hypothetical protein IFM89_017909 [Coptis chinensis]
MTFPFVLKACARLSDFQLGLKIHTHVLKADVFAKTSLLCIYARCGCLNEAHRLFNEMPTRNVVSWTAIISGYIKAGRFSEAVDSFKKMLEMELMPDSFTLVRLLS